MMRTWLLNEIIVLIYKCQLCKIHKIDLKVVSEPQKQREAWAIVSQLYFRSIACKANY